MGNYLNGKDRLIDRNTVPRLHCCVCLLRGVGGVVLYQGVVEQPQGRGFLANVASSGFGSRQRKCHQSSEEWKGRREGRRGKGGTAAKNRTNTWITTFKFMSFIPRPRIVRGKFESIFYFSLESVSSNRLALMRGGFMLWFAGHVR